jgi:NAD(P)-dependent dehydrogenase (short-subunit alcohol dehydrogenase family)
MNMGKPVCVVLGVGPGNGAALAKRFAAEGYAVALLARGTTFTADLAKTLPDSRAYACDASDPASIAAAFGDVRRDLGDVAVLVYNAGSGTWGTVEDIKLDDFESSWRVNALGSLAASREVIPAMKKVGKGSIVFIGATASRRGVAKTAAFAPAKAAQRSLAESMARHLWPAGIHVSIIIIDGVVGTPRARAARTDKPASFFLEPDDIADTAFRLTQQSPSAWSFEVEARPFGETW